MSSFIYNKGKVALLDGSVDLDDDTIKVVLVTASYTPDKADDEFLADVTNEVSGTGYTAGGKPLANVQLIQDDAYDRVIVDADDEEGIVFRAESIPVDIDVDVDHSYMA